MPKRTRSRDRRTSPPRAGRATASEEHPRLVAAADRLTPFHRAAIVVIALKVVFVTLVFDPLGADAFAVPKTAASRAAFYVLLMLLGAYFILYRPRLSRSRVWAFVGAYVAIAILATLFAQDRTVSLYGAPRRLLGLTSVLDGAVTALAVAVFVRRRGDLVVIGGAFCLGLVAALAYGALQSARLDPVTWVDPLVGSVVGNSTNFGGYLLVAAAVSMGATALYWSEVGVSARVALFALAAAAAAELLATRTRGPLLMSVPTLAAVAVVVWRSQVPWIARLAERWRHVVLVAGALLMALPLLLLGGERLGALFRGDPSITERAIIYRVSAEAILQRPLLGSGPDNLVVVYPLLRPAEAASLPAVTASQSSTHNWVLHHAVGSGLVGLAAIAGAVVVALTVAWRRTSLPNERHLGLAAIALIGFLGQGMFDPSHVVTETIFWHALGLAATPALGTALPATVPSRAGAFRRPSGPVSSELVTLAAAVMFGLAASTTVANSLLANRELLASNAARRAGLPDAAVTYARSALARDAARADHWNVLGLAYSRRQPEPAARAFAKAAELAPYDPVYWLNLGAEEAVLGERDPDRRAAAIAHAGLALKVEPNGPTTLRRASEILAVAGQLAEARSAMERAIDLNPRDGSARYWAAEVYEALGEHRLAAATLERALELEPPGARVPAATLQRLARLYDLTGRSAEARSAIRRAIAVNPGDQSVLLWAADIHEASGEHRLAAALLEKALALEPPGSRVPPAMQLRLGRLYHRVGDFARVRELIPPPRAVSVVICGNPCLAVQFDSLEELVAEGPSSPTDRSNYVIAGSPIPASVRLESSRGGRVIALEWPGGRPPTGTTVVVANVRNILGMEMEPNPATLRAP